MDKWKQLYPIVPNLVQLIHLNNACVQNVHMYIAVPDDLLSTDAEVSNDIVVNV